MTNERKTFEDYLAERSIASRYHRKGESPLRLALEDAKRQNLPPNLIQQAEEKGIQQTA